MMYIDFSQLHAKYSPVKKIRGVVHVGACTGEERGAYSQCGVEHVAWFEANPETYRLLYENVRWIAGHEVHNMLLSDDHRTVDFYVTSNFRAASSSMLELAKHSEFYPKIVVDKTLRLPTRRFDCFVTDSNFPLEQFNFLNMDVQGAELKVLRGIGDFISRFDYVYSEINTDELYSGCVQLPELEQYLNERGFVRRETNLTEFQWGDALFVRDTIAALTEGS